MSEPAIVCIHGMHRSGTSLVARVLNVLGVDLGPQEHLMRPSRANPTGYWENVPITDINDEILDRFGGSWSQPPDLPAGWERRPELADLRQRARDQIESDFSGSDLWGFKDPRCSLTAPFWQAILPPIRYVICLRNPVDVAASLGARQAEPLEFDHGTRLWLSYTRSALAVTTGRPRELVFYEDLMADPEPIVRRLAQFIGRRPADAAEPQTDAAVEVTVQENLWHNRTPVANVVDAQGLGFDVKAFYVALRQTLPGTERAGIEVLDMLGSYATAAGRRLAELEAGQEELELARQRSQALESERGELQGRLSDAREELERRGAQLADEREARREVERELEQTRAELDATRAELSRWGPTGAARTAEGGGGEAVAPSPRELDYARRVGEIRARAEEIIPPDATVLVASKGDDALLRLGARSAWHFPIAPDGRYAGHHPASDTAAIAQLEALRARGADHLLLPATTLWWLDHYGELRRHLDERYGRLFADELCVIYALRTDAKPGGGAAATLASVLAALRLRSDVDPAVLAWGTGSALSEQLPEVRVFEPPGDAGSLPYLDATVDVVVVPASEGARLDEARRVAARAVVKLHEGSAGAEVEWLDSAGGGWGANISVTLVPDAASAPWEATLRAFAETLGNGFAGELNIVGTEAALAGLSDPPEGCVSSMRKLEVAPATSLSDRASAAAAASDGRIQVFCARPAVPLADWLPSLVAPFSSEPETGVAGARILSPYGVLEEAGGILDAGGSKRRWGEGDVNPDRPQYRFVRRVDFCSPPVIATRRDLFERLNGFHPSASAPADAVVDYSLRARAAGAPIYYQPQTRVVALAGDAS